MREDRASITCMEFIHSPFNSQDLDDILRGSVQNKSCAALHAGLYASPSCRWPMYHAWHLLNEPIHNRHFSVISFMDLNPLPASHYYTCRRF